MRIGTGPLTITDLSLDELQELVRQPVNQAYAVLDACDEPRVPQKVLELGEHRAVSLYRGTAQRDYWSIAPYLVQLDDGLLEWVIQNLWEDAWGVIALSSIDLAGMRKHLRRFLTVEDPQGEPMYFRFYDPRVLGPFLQTCNGHELSLFYGPMSMLIACEGPAALRSYCPALKP